MVVASVHPHHLRVQRVQRVESEHDERACALWQHALCDVLHLERTDGAFRGLRHPARAHHHQLRRRCQVGMKSGSEYGGDREALISMIVVNLLVFATPIVKTKENKRAPPLKRTRF